LIHSLKNQYTIVIVTHNMQQAARVSDYTGFFLMGEMVEFDETPGFLPIRVTGGRKITSPDGSARP